MVSRPRRTRDYPEMGYEAGVKAMLDAHITYDDVETGVACYCYGDTTSGQRIFYQFGMSTIPIFNTNNACATGSTGLFLGRTLIKNGAADCVMVIGFEQMQPGSIKSVWSDRPSPMGLSSQMMEDTHGKHDSPRNAQYFANAGNEYVDKSVSSLHSSFVQETLTLHQIWRQIRPLRPLRRNRAHLPRPQPSKPLRSIPQRLHL